MNAESKLLIGALRKAVTGQAPQLNTQVDWAAFLMLTRFHKVEGLVYDGLKEETIPPEGEKALSAAYHRAIFQDTQLEYTKTQLEASLQKAGVPHVFLKGARLKYDYPVPALRTMSDMDILVYTRDYDRVDDVSQALGGKLLDGDGNHRNFVFPGNVKVEFHPNILHHSAPVGVQINPGWQYVEEGKMTEEGLYLTVMTHLADHFVTGGIGVRFVLDIWVLLNRHPYRFDRSFVEQELKNFGLLEFACNVEDLAEAWFGSGEMTPLLEELGEYILTSGSHGYEGRAMLNSVALSGSSTKALWRKVFYPRSELEDRFPWCKGRPLLLPAAWFARAFRAVTKRGNLIAKWHKGTGNISKEQIAAQKQKLSRFGIRKN